MLNSLSIENYALIGKVKIDFDSKLNILTGETGAGKSIIIGALSMVLGERAGSDLVRTGEDKAYVEASFSVDKNKKIAKALEAIGLEPDSNLIISREILSAGKSQARINGRAVTQSILRSVSKNLIDIHGQHEHQSLLNPENHIDLLDNLGGKTLLQLREKVSKGYNKLISLKEELSSLEQGKAEREKNIDYMKYQINEITEAGLQEDEEDDLKDERDRLANAEKLASGASEISNLLSGSEESGVLDKLRSASSKLKDLAGIDKSLSKFSKTLDTSYFQAEDISGEIASYLDKIEFNPSRLEEVEERLELIRELKRKYGDSIKQVLKKEEEIQSQLDGLQGSDERINELTDEVKDLNISLGKLCLELSDKRKELGKKIEIEVQKELAELNMPKVKFKVDLKSVEDENGVAIKSSKLKASSKGTDIIEFLISPNPGEPLKSLAKIASGGEISRVMLAIKSILSKADDIPTMIFDEIDVGIGGQTAIRVGDKLSALSDSRQIICITHLPQIASKPAKHLHVSKSTESGKTHVSLRELKKDDRVKEIAHLLGGKASEATMNAAKELIG